MTVWLARRRHETPLVTPPEVHLQCEVLRLTALLGELDLILREGWDADEDVGASTLRSTVCLRNWFKEETCVCVQCRALRVIRYGLP